MTPLRVLPAGDAASALSSRQASDSARLSAELTTVPAAPGECKEAGP